MTEHPPAEDGTPDRARGRLRVFLGAAPGVGKTVAMLDQAQRRAARGKDVVVGFVETHGRPKTAERLAGLELVPRTRRAHRGVEFEEMDLDAVLARHPAVVLVDELAHTNVPGGRHPKRWQDVRDLLDAGIDVVTTVNIQHLESVNDVVEKITGVPQRETVPDAFVRSADQIELVDMSAEGLRRRLAHGNVYAPEKVDAALANYFREGNLTALRELALLWTADRVDDALQAYRERHRISGTWETRERVVVALTGGREGDTLIRRAARIANRAGGELLAVHVTRSDGLSRQDPADLTRQRDLVESLGGEYHRVLAEPGSAAVSRSLLTFARAENATQLVLGDSRRSRLLAMLTGPGIGARTVRGSGDIDVHIVTHAGVGSLALAGLRGPRGALGRGRLLGGLAAAVIGPVLLTLLLTPLVGELNLVSDMLAFLLLTVVVSVIGGLAPALVAALLGSALINYFFTPPLHTFTIGETNNTVALVVFVVVALVVSTVVDTSVRLRREAARSAAEARTLADLAATAPVDGDVLEPVLRRLRETFGLESVTLLADGKDGDVHSGEVLGSSGPPCTAPDDADTTVPAGDGRVLVLSGHVLRADDRRVVTAFGAQIAALVERAGLRRTAGEAAELAELDRVRTALLAAVGHDLRTPLAAAKASVAGLRSRDVTLPEADRRELLATAEESIDRLAALVDNLLDMSRLQAGMLSVQVLPTDVGEVVARALDTVGPTAADVATDVPDDLPMVAADPGLLERVLANLVANAIRYSGGRDCAGPPLVSASTLGGRVEVRVVDRGPGIGVDDLDRVFQPFQRLGDTDNGTGIGLGLALARGLTEGMGGTLEPAETPGGGLTMVVSLPAATDGPAPVPGRRERAGGAGPTDSPVTRPARIA